jgi:hypothetical protein
MATGQVLFHRFYYSKSFVKNPMEVCKFFNYLICNIFGVGYGNKMMRFAKFCLEYRRFKHQV